MQDSSYVQKGALDIHACLQRDTYTHVRVSGTFKLHTRDISFKHTLLIWVTSIERVNTVLLVHNKDLKVYQLIAQIKVGNRPGRVEPRAVKRRSKPYPRLKTDRDTARENIRKSGHGKKRVA